VNKDIILFKKIEDCCGCGTCQLICPRKAISMKKDKYGFFYPVINKSQCISCGKCQKICAFQNNKEKDHIQKVYALSLKDNNLIQKTASGGVFGGIAKQWINDGGVVFGVALIKERDCLSIKHCKASTNEELIKLLGSKYVQSDLSNTLSETKQLLDAGEKVLFSGTPCQIAGLNAYLKKDYENLLTIDLVCHGVPNQEMFNSYIKNEESRLHKPIQDFKFRDKENGWGLNARIYYGCESKCESKIIKSNCSSYYQLFLNGDIYRESCYHCPYTNEHHPADLTIGDFWGIEEEHPIFLSPNGKLEKSKGVSMIMINNDKGEKFFNLAKNLFWCYPSTFKNVAKHNEQLKHPSRPGKNRDVVLNLYHNHGYKTVDKWFWRQKKNEKTKEKIKYHLHNDIPKPIRQIGKEVFNQIRNITRR